MTTLEVNFLLKSVFHQSVLQWAPQYRCLTELVDIIPVVGQGHTLTYEGILVSVSASITVCRFKYGVFSYVLTFPGPIADITDNVTYLILIG